MDSGYIAIIVLGIALLVCISAVRRVPFTLPVFVMLLMFAEIATSVFHLLVPSLTPSVHRQSPLFVELTQTKTKRLFSKNKFAQRHVMLLLYLF